MRKFIVGGNWKMNGDLQLVKDVCETFNTLSLPVEVVIAPPFPYLQTLRSQLHPSLSVSAQNCSDKLNGAYTGEVSPSMLVNLSVDYVILGHSERRDIYKETSDLIGEKVSLALKNGLKVIACIGEHLQDRKDGNTMQVVIEQLKGISDKLTKEEWKNVVLAYEPVWAIGTGVVATPSQAQETHEQIREWLSSNVGEEVGKETRIMYGGSVNAKNCQELANQKDIDGFLVGGASLKVNDFLTICKSKL